MIHKTITWLGIFLVLVSLTALGGIATAAAQTPLPTPTPSCPAGEFFDPVMNRCRRIVQPCPAGTIDLQGNGEDDGGDDCQPLDQLPAPAGCAPLTGSPLNSREGEVACALPWRLNGAPVVMNAAVGCLDIRRSPYPRTMVNLGQPTRLELEGMVQTPALGIGYGGAGWYRTTGRPWTVQGLYLHERYGGPGQFDTRQLLANDRYPYPSVNGVVAVLELAADTGRTLWDIPGGAQGVQVLQASGPQAQFQFERAGFPLPGEAANTSMDGPNRANENALPAFRVAVRSRWEARLLVEYDVYGIVNNAYVRQGRVGPIAIPLGNYWSRRAWDYPQPSNSAGFCDAANGYIPVPVIEGQAVLRR